MTNLESYKRAEQNLKDAKEWLALKNKKYSGGGGGIGDYQATCFDTKIYFQAHDGAKNYHQCPPMLAHHICNMIHDNLDTLVAEGIKKLEQQIKAWIPLVKEEYEKIINQA